MPTAGKLLLDTNAVIALFSREPPIDRLVGAATAVRSLSTSLRHLPVAFTVALRCSHEAQRAG
jgi:hypothetical protein